MTSILFPGNLAFTGTVSAPLFISNQQVIAPVAAGTASTLTVSSISTGFITASTLSVGTLLNFNVAGTIGTNLSLSGTLSAMYGSITQGYTATLSVGTILNFSQAATVSSAGTTSGTLSGTSTGTLLIAGSASILGTITTTCLGINQTSPGYPLDLTGSARITGTLLSATISTTSISAMYASLTQTFATTMTALLGNIGSASFGSYLGLNTSTPNYQLDVNGAGNFAGLLYVNGGTSNGMIRITNSNGVNYIQSGTSTVGNSTAPLWLGGSISSTNTPPLCLLGASNFVGINNTSPAYTLDVTGNLRLTGSLTTSKQVPWTALTSFGTGVSAYSGYGTPQYCVDELGYVRTRGLLSYSTSYTKGQALFTMPTAGRPVYGGNYILVGLLCNQGIVEVDFLPSGAVNLSAAQPTVSSGSPGFVTSGYISLEGVCFWPGTT